MLIALTCSSQRDHKSKVNIIKQTFKKYVCVFKIYVTCYSIKKPCLSSTFANTLVQGKLITAFCHPILLTSSFL